MNDGEQAAVETAPVKKKILSGVVPAPKGARKPKRGRSLLAQAARNKELALKKESNRKKNKAAKASRKKNRN